MIQSMTGFGKAQAENEFYQVTVEIKSVNNRFRDLRFKMGQILSSLEIDLRKKLEQTFKRGSFDVYVNYTLTQGSISQDIDLEKASAFLDHLKNLCAPKNVTVSVRPSDFLRNEFYKTKDDDRVEGLKALVRATFETALIELEKARRLEGSKLKTVLLGHREDYLREFSKIENLSPKIQSQVEEKLKKRFSELKEDIKLDESRFMQEVLYYLEKLDTREEIDRIKSHTHELKRILETEDECEMGRKIDFLLQELHRETNTMGSKTSDQEITSHVVSMKVILEKLREQALNIQ